MTGCGLKDDGESNTFSDIYPDFSRQEINNIVIIDSLDKVISKQNVNHDFLSRIENAKGVMVNFYPTKRIVFLNDSIRIDSMYLGSSNYIKYNGSTFELQNKIW